MDETRVLIVDDCLDLRKLMSDYLGSQEGISVIGEASNGIAALKILSEEKVDIILLDIVMPQMDGFTMLQEMRNIPINPNLKVIAVSALAGEVFIKQAIDLGVHYYMAKPFDIKALLAQIRENAARPISHKEPIQHCNSEKETMDERISMLFLAIGIPAHILGFKYLREAIKMVIANPDAINRITTDLYPAVGKRCNTATCRVERAMRHAIELAWKQRDKEALSKIFDYKSNSMADKPTNGEFIALIAEHMSRKKTA